MEKTRGLDSDRRTLRHMFKLELSIPLDFFLLRRVTGKDTEIISAAVRPIRVTQKFIGQL